MPITPSASVRDLYGKCYPDPDSARLGVAARLGVILPPAGSRTLPHCIDQHGYTYQVKYRSIAPRRAIGNLSFDWATQPPRFHYLLGIILNAEDCLVGLIHVDYETILQL